MQGAAVTLPKWNNEWEKPDPLRGARGWCRHHYATVVVAAGLLVTATGLGLPAVIKARREAQKLEAIPEQMREAVAEAGTGLHGHR